MQLKTQIDTVCGKDLLSGYLDVRWLKHLALPGSRSTVWVFTDMERRCFVSEEHCVHMGGLGVQLVRASVNRLSLPSVDSGPVLLSTASAGDSHLTQIICPKRSARCQQVSPGTSFQVPGGT